MEFQDRKDAWKALYAGERKAVAILHFDDGVRPWPYPQNKRERIAYALNTYRRQRERAEWLRDDRVPFLSPYTGTEIFAQAFGCKVHLSGDNMPFALPLVHSAQDAAALKVPDPVGALPDVWEIAHALHAVYPEAILALPDIQSPMDIAALIWEKSAFYTAMIEEPEAVMELTDKIYTLLTGFLDEWFRTFGSEFIAHYPDYYMPAGVTLSEDEIGVISPGMFRQFCLPHLNALSQRYGGIGIHCCADSRHQWKGFQTVQGLKTLNLVREADVLAEAYGFFRNDCVQMHNISSIGPDGRLALPESAKNARVVLQAWVKNKAEGQRSLELLRQGQAQHEDGGDGG
jgi:uroporphyrinogen-III decarboxylase